MSACAMVVRGCHHLLPVRDPYRTDEYDCYHEMNTGDMPLVASIRKALRVLAL